MFGTFLKVTEFYVQIDTTKRMLLKLERGTGNGERGTGNGERGTGNGESS